MFYHNTQRSKRRFCPGYKADLRLPKGNLSLTGFTLLEMLITIVLLTAGVVALMRILSLGIFADTDVENVTIALNLANEKMEEVKNLSYGNITDNPSDGGWPSESWHDKDTDPDLVNFPNFERQVDLREGTEPKEVWIRVRWTVKGVEVPPVELVMLIADID